MGFWKYYGVTDSGQRPLLFPNGSTIIIVLASWPRRAGPSLLRPVRCGVIILDSARSWSSVTQRSIHILHLPVHTLHDDLVKMTVFVPQGVTCFSGASFDCTSSFENWQKALMDEGRRVYPGKNPDTMIFHRVHKSIEEVCPVFEPAVKHFILADTEEQEHTRTVVFAIFTARFEFFGASHWTPVTQVWDILDLCGGDRRWIIYHNNQRLRHQKVMVHQGDFFACYERCDSNPLSLDDRPITDVDQGWVANAPMPVPCEATKSTTSLPLVGDATGSAHNEASPTFQSTGDPLLLIGRRGGRRARMTVSSHLIWILFDRQKVGTPSDIQIG